MKRVRKIIFYPEMKYRERPLHQVKDITIKGNYIFSELQQRVDHNGIKFSFQEVCIIYSEKKSHNKSRDWHSKKIEEYYWMIEKKDIYDIIYI